MNQPEGTPAVATAWVRFPSAPRLKNTSPHFQTVPTMRLTLIFIYCSLIMLPAGAQEVQYLDGKVMAWPVKDGATLEVYRGEISLSESLNKSPIIGRTGFSGDTLIFTPLISFTMGESYTTVLEHTLFHHFQVPSPENYLPPLLTKVYPSADTLPANLLKFHLRFSRPMQMGNVYAHLALLTAEGDTVDRAILPLDPPLWNHDRTLLTLWLEPGRIKRDLGPYDRLGPILKEGKYYTLAVDAGMKDENGQSLVVPGHHTFYVEERDTLVPKADTWDIHSPDSGSEDPLIISFGEPLDWATLSTYISLENDQRNEVQGRWQIFNREREARFLPKQPWAPGTYRLVIDPKLEDVAGNNMERLFDRPAGTDVTGESITVLKVKIE